MKPKAIILITVLSPIMLVSIILGFISDGLDFISLKLMAFCDRVVDKAVVKSLLKKAEDKK